MTPTQAELAPLQELARHDSSRSDVPLLEVSALRFGPAGRALAEPLSFTLERGRCLVLLGPNGVGKTSLMRTLTGALAPLGGSIRWRGRGLAALAERERASMMAYVAARPVDESAFTVGHLALLGRVASRSLWSRASAADHQRVDEVLGLLGIERLSDRVLAQLSDGERQLAQIARALAQDAEALIFDEPAASLDLAHQARILATLRKLASKGSAVVFSTHDPNHALAIADQVLLWQTAGRITWGSAEQLLRPEPLSDAYGVAITVYRTDDGAKVLGLRP